MYDWMLLEVIWTVSDTRLPSTFYSFIPTATPTYTQILDVYPMRANSNVLTKAHRSTFSQTPYSCGKSALEANPQKQLLDPIGHQI